MVEHDVEQQQTAAGVDGVGELLELVDRRRAGIDLDERGVDRGEIQRRVGAPVAAAAPVRGGNGSDREQLECAAAEGVEHVGEQLHEPAQRAGGRDHAEAASVERADRSPGALQRTMDVVTARGAYECAVQGVPRAQPVRVDGQHYVAAHGPMLAAGGVRAVRLRAEAADLEQRQLQLEAAVRALERNVAPGGAAEGGRALLAQARLRDHASPQQRGTREVGAQEAARAIAELRGRPERHAQAIAHEAQQLRAGCRRHGGRLHGGGAD